MSESGLTISGSKITFEVFKGSLGEFLLQNFRKLPRDQIIQVDGETGEEQKVQEFLQLSIGVAQGLINLGLKPGVDIVPLIANYSWESIAVAIGGALANIAIYPIDPSLKTFEIKHLLEPCKPKIIFCEKNCIRNALSDVLQMLPNPTKVYILDGEANARGCFFKFRDIIDKEKSIDDFIPPLINSPADTPILISKSSGTTGLPKPILLTHTNVVFQLQSYGLNPAITAKRPYLLLTYIYWLSGPIALYLSCFGVKNIFLNNMMSNNIVKTVQNYKPEWTFTAPDCVSNMLAHPDLLKYDVSSLIYIAVGGSVLHKSLVERFKKQWPGKTIFSQVYGMTELTGGLTSPSLDDVQSVGKLKPGILLKVADLTTGQALGPNETGELRFKTDYLTMKGYLNDEEGTRKAFDESGFYKSGDLGYYTDNGNLYVTGRIREFIMCKNIRVPPAEIEDVILAMPGIMDVGVIGVPHETDLNRPMAFVVKKSNCHLNEVDIINYVAENLSEGKHLYGGVKFVASIPRTSNGKIKRYLLEKLI